MKGKGQVEGYDILRILLEISTNEKREIVMCRLFIGQKFRKEFTPTPALYLHLKTPTLIAIALCVFTPSYIPKYIHEAFYDEGKKRTFTTKARVLKSLLIFHLYGQYTSA